MECTTLDNDILRNFGTIDSYDLTSIVKCDTDSKNEYFDNFQLKSSHYYDLQSLVSGIKNYPFSIMSMNCQSLNSKFDSILLLVEELHRYNCNIGVICLQETWLDDNFEFAYFNIPGYICLGQGRYCSAHGGLITYVHNSLKYDSNITSIKSDSVEGLFVKILNDSNKDLYVGNLYRPPRENNSEIAVQAFIDDLNPVISNMINSHSMVALVGDYNIDLLKYHEKIGSKIFFYYILSVGMIPNVNLPTRVADSSATLIDNVFTSNLDNYEDSTCFCGTLTVDISDHFPCFYGLGQTFRKQNHNTYVIKPTFDDASIEKLFHALMDKNLISHINVDIRADPNENYNILSNILTTTLDKCIPCKKVRYNKYKHKNSQWITSGILKSIRFRDRLYQKVKKTSHDSNKFRVLKENLKVYNQVLKKAVRQMKFNYYSNTFEKYKNNTKKTWETINNITGKKAFISRICHTQRNKNNKL